MRSSSYVLFIKDGGMQWETDQDFICWNEDIAVMYCAIEGV